MTKVIINFDDFINTWSDQFTNCIFHEVLYLSSKACVNNQRCFAGFWYPVLGLLWPILLYRWCYIDRSWSNRTLRVERVYKNQPLSTPASQTPSQSIPGYPIQSQDTQGIIQSGGDTNTDSKTVKKSKIGPNAYIISRQGRGREELRWDMRMRLWRRGVAFDMMRQVFVVVPLCG